MKMLKNAVFLALILALIDAYASEEFTEWSPKNHQKFLIREWVKLEDCLEANFDSDYINHVFAPHINPNEVNLIFEIGSRDAIDAIALSEYFTSPVYAFECHPDAVEVCKGNIGENPNVHLINSSVWDIDGEITFHPVIPDGEEYLLGASSIFPIDSSGPFGNSQLQKEICVNACRLDTWIKSNNLSSPDLLCIDVQGGTLQVLKSLGGYLHNVKYIIAEVESKRYYEGQALVNEVLDYIIPYSFQPVAMIDLSKWGFPGVMNVLFIKHDILGTQTQNFETDLSHRLYASVNPTDEN